MTTADRASSATRPRASKQKARRRALAFYRGAMTVAEQLLLDDAAEVEGLDGEIATLRVKLRTAIDEHPDDVKLMALGMDLLVKAMSARYKMSKESREDLADSINGVLRGVGVQLAPELFGDV